MTRLDYLGLFPELRELLFLLELELDFELLCDDEEDRLVLTEDLELEPELLLGETDCLEEPLELPPLLVSERLPLDLPLLPPFTLAGADSRGWVWLGLLPLP